MNRSGLLSAASRTAVAAAAVLALAVVVLAVRFRHDALGLGMAGLALAFLSVPVVGAAVVRAQPRNPVGWVLLASGVSLPLGVAAYLYSHAAFAGAWLPAAVWAAWLDGWPWTPALTLVPAVGLLLFPDGRSASPRWRPLLWAGWAVLAAQLCNGLFAPHLLDYPRLPNPTALPGVAGSLADVLGATIVLVPPMATLSAWSVHRRWRRAPPGTGAAAALRLVMPAAWLVAASWWGCGVAILATGDSNNALAMEALGMVAVAVTAWIAMRRYGLFDARQVLNRALVYAGLSVCGIGIYLAVAAVVGSLTSTALSGPVGLLAAVLVALPLRDVLQRGANRLMYGDRDDPYGVAERRLLAGIAQQVAAAGHAVSLTRDLRRSRERLVTATEEERRRIRRDLHDGLGPGLAGVVLGLQRARRQVTSDAAAAVAQLDTLTVQTQEAIAEVRRLVYEPAPALEELGLIGALRERARALGAITVHGPAEELSLPAAVEVAAYRIVLEAMTNIARHARARDASVQISVDGALRLEITDDGDGMPEAFSAGVGITSMRERATELGGHCTVTPRHTPRHDGSRDAPAGGRMSTDNPIRVMVADDHPVFRSGLRTLVEESPLLEYAGEAADGEQAVAVCQQQRPDVVLMDIRMPGVSGIDATRQIMAARPETGVLMLTMLEDDTSVFAAMRAGACGYILKGADPDQITRAITSVAAGELIFGAALATHMATFFRNGSRDPVCAFPGLSSREHDILHLIAAGQSNAAIAERLALSEKTIRNNVSSIFAKLRVADRSAAIVQARDVDTGPGKDLGCSRRTFIGVPVHCVRSSYLRSPDWARSLSRRRDRRWKVTTVRRLGRYRS